MDEQEKPPVETLEDKIWKAISTTPIGTTVRPKGQKTGVKN